MGIQKGVDEPVFNYDFTDCADYKFDTNLMEFIIDGRDDILPASDNNVTARRFILKNLYQSNLPINKYFYMRVKGVWKNTWNVFD